MTRSRISKPAPRIARRVLDRKALQRRYAAIEAGLRAKRKPLAEAIGIVIATFYRRA